MQNLGKITLVKLNNTNPRAYKVVFENPKDIGKLITYARLIYKLKTKKKRIVYKYVRKLMLEALRRVQRNIKET